MNLDKTWRRQVSLLVDAMQRSDLVTLDVEHGAFAVHIERDAAVPAVDSPLATTVIEGADHFYKEPPVLRSPQVGTFYLSAEPDGDPFLSVGGAVEQGQVIGLIEAMKLISEVEADQSGTVRRILVEDGEPVEYGQPLAELE